MTTEPPRGQIVDVALRPWSDGDLTLLERLLGDPAMTVHLGGPESAEEIRWRHIGYLGVGDTSAGRMFAITTGPEQLAVGSTGYWEVDRQGETVWETGVSVLPEVQGRGIATRALVQIVEHARTEALHDSIHAFPAVENEPSNALCRRAGFTLIGPCEYEYPPGHVMRCNDWVVEFPHVGDSSRGTRPGIVTT
jgi:RimJ/RimL family protein N-acetyltransferase